MLYERVHKTNLRTKRIKILSLQDCPLKIIYGRIRKYRLCRRIWWFANSWTKSLHCHQIAVKELFPIVIALELWGKYMVNSKVLFLSDNQAVVDVLNKQSCRDKISMRLARRLVLCTLSYNIVFRAKHTYIS
jgi:hypothetical protein